MLCHDIPLDQCLCDHCENCEQLLKSLHAIGMRNVPSNRYTAVDYVVCPGRQQQIGSKFSFPAMKCITGDCDQCGEHLLHEAISENNAQILHDNKHITWHKWMVKTGKSAPDKCVVKGTVCQAVQELLNLVKPLKSHLFRANWHKNLFDYVRQNIAPGHIIQIFDFAMNFRNLYQDEVQSAYWDRSQTGIHAVINYFRCPAESCSENVTLILAQITDDLKHDSFVARAGHDMSFKYLASLNIPMDLIIQFCDNCGSQYKSRRPFAEMARCPLNLLRIYFGEKHGKSQCDGFFGRLKSWMTYRIKSRKVIINNAHDFFRSCKDDYETPTPAEGTCQHYRVIFQFLHPSQIRRHQDCDLDEAVTGTQNIYSVRNISEPLSLKICNVPCLCMACISGNGEVCANAQFTDDWRNVQLKPVKGDNKWKHKKKHPKDMTVIVNTCENEEENEDEDLPEIVLEESAGDALPMADVEINSKDGDELFIDLTDGKESSSDNSFEHDEEDDVIISQSAKEVSTLSAHEDNTMIPDKIYWESVLSSLERCTTFSELCEIATSLKKSLRPLRKRIMNVHFHPERDYIDSTAAASIPLDGPQNVHAIWIPGDGNCCTRSLSKGYSGSEAMHLEIHARIVISGVLDMEHYLSPRSLNRGATLIRDNETLPEIYSKYSDYYVSGQKVTKNTIEYMYIREIHRCTRPNMYLGLWQLAQAATVLNSPIQSIYPEGGDAMMRLDFNRMFFPIKENVETHTEPICVLWTSAQKGSPPMHFMPLLPKRNKYE